VTGNELRAARQKKGLSQAVLADMLGVSSNTVARWERGEMKIARPQVEIALRNIVEDKGMSGFQKTMQLAREGNALALGLLKLCYEYVLKNGNEDFAGKWVLGGIPVINLRTLAARGLLLKVGSSRGGHRAYYQMADPSGTGRALRTLGIVN
jgi:DNA-binding XRE family transcriptional regulator